MKTPVERKLRQRHTQLGPQVDREKEVIHAMAIPWLAALKIVPWGDVIEHAPKVLGAARQLLERQKERQRKKIEGEQVPTVDDVVEVEAHDPVAVLQQAVADQSAEIERLRQNQMALTDTLAELAEQHARLVSTTEALRVRSRFMGWALAAVVVCGIGLAIALKP